MTRRFGGRYSPEARDDHAPVRAPARPHPVGARVNLLFVVPFAFAIRAFFNDPVGLALNLGAFGVLMLAAWLTREGVLAQAAYEARKVARRPAIPRKIFASVLTGAGLALAAVSGGTVVALIFAILGAVLHFGAFGPDPLRDKGMEGVDTFQTDRVARAVEEAQSHLNAMQDAIKRSGDRALARRVEGFSNTIRQLFRAIENDPRQLNAARRYLGIYLVGARDATVKFADLYARNHDTQARVEYEALLDDLENRFSLRREALLESDRTDLEIEIEVLRERLEREGLRAD
ncbi:5-bromo-4-chloroindolyl phosphate hydrolysis family protein [Roseinatronobacter alkalisoli]|uniref:5-bromo-4-chloroindolyl phosphate hydrolysis family protein n=1 Tax=Roseinatronobacter alkalisoli TaxID=3028235 RepID=A0ABT5T872_9RHOB|nr:5-bromo-4-chloroindolyl phosphate hydrolysis family protein [Roseinatronobacter sp. HJB301]MDD7970382.1 5-bromo-4-chloroindolyl phosphate hydrolysis family protein [Roseinatronobacter sp. HJB301]